MGVSDARTDAQRVLIIGINYAPEPTGISPYTTAMSEELVRRGRQVRVLTSYPHYPWWRVPDEYRSLPRSSSVNGVRVTRLRHYVPKAPRTITRALFELAFGLRAAFSRWGRPDVIVLVSPAIISSIVAIVRARVQRVRTITWVQDIYTLGVAEASSGTGAGMIARLERGLANASDRVVVIHDRFRRVFVERLGARTPVDVVRNWSHVPEISGERREQTRARHGWGDEETIVLHAGAMGAKQGLENVVLAAREASRRGARIRFVLLGDGNQRARLEAMGADPRLLFIDPLPDGEFRDVIAAADVLLVNERAGLTEMSVPSKLTTYFATGLPVIAAVDESSTTHDEMVAAGAGPVVAAEDPSALVDAVVALASDDDAARRYGVAARSYRREVLSASAAADAFERSLDA